MEYKKYKQIEKNGKLYQVYLVQKKVKNFSVRLTRQKEILYTCPIRASRSQIDEQYERFYNWIYNHINESETIDNNKMLFMGKMYEVKYGSMKNEFKDGVIYLIDESVDSKRKFLNKYCDYLVYLFDKTLEETHIENCTLNLKFLKSKWGCCYFKRRSITLNKYLICFDEEIVKSVIYHEISHLSVSNHSKDFYEVLRRYDPSYREHRNVLKKNNHVLL